MHVWTPIFSSSNQWRDRYCKVHIHFSLPSDHSNPTYPFYPVHILASTDLGRAYGLAPRITSPIFSEHFF
jgi:hypothetical protein